MHALIVLQNHDQVGVPTWHDPAATTVWHDYKLIANALVTFIDR